MIDGLRLEIIKKIMRLMGAFRCPEGGCKGCPLHVASTDKVSGDTTLDCMLVLLDDRLIAIEANEV